MRENQNHIVKCKTRYTALAMSAILVFTTVLGNTSIAALALVLSGIPIFFSFRNQVDDGYNQPQPLCQRNRKPYAPLS